MAFKFRIYSGMQSDSLVYKDCSCDRFADFNDHRIIKISNIINIKIINNMLLFVKFINNNIVFMNNKLYVKK